MPKRISDSVVDQVIRENGARPEYEALREPLADLIRHNLLSSVPADAAQFVYVDSVIRVGLVVHLPRDFVLSVPTDRVPATGVERAVRINQALLALKLRKGKGEEEVLVTRTVEFLRAENSSLWERVVNRPSGDFSGAFFLWTPLGLVTLWHELGGTRPDPGVGLA
jgi:hypothetical protein